MASRLKKIDDYIDASEDFAKPILIHFRELVHEACPEVEEGWKWNFPHFLYSGDILCYMASFKKHCTFGFWKAELLIDPENVLNKVGSTGMGQLGKIQNIKDLPSDDVIRKYIHEAGVLNEKGIKVNRSQPKQKELQINELFLEKLKKNEQAFNTFNDFSYTNKKEYVEWINDAKTEATRIKRIDTALEWISEGKVKNWKYIKK